MSLKSMKSMLSLLAVTIISTSLQAMTIPSIKVNVITSDGYPIQGISLTQHLGAEHFQLFTGGDLFLIPSFKPGHVSRVDDIEVLGQTDQNGKLSVPSNEWNPSGRRPFVTHFLSGHVDVCQGKIGSANLLSDMNGNHMPENCQTNFTEQQLTGIVEIQIECKSPLTQSQVEEKIKTAQANCY